MSKLKGTCQVSQCSHVCSGMELTSRGRLPAEHVYITETCDVVERVLSSDSKESQEKNDVTIQPTTLCSVLSCAAVSFMAQCL